MHESFDAACAIRAQSLPTLDKQDPATTGTVTAITIGSVSGAARRLRR